MKRFWCKIVHRLTIGFRGLSSSRRSARAALLLAVNLGPPFGLELLKLSIECLPGRTDARVAVNHALLSVISFGNRNSPKVLSFENTVGAVLDAPDEAQHSSRI